MSALVGLPDRLRRSIAGGRQPPSMADLTGIREALLPGPRAKRAAVGALALVTVLTAVYFFWLRDSGLVGVEDVTVSGVTSQDADQIRSALTRAGRGMTSLHVDQESLERSVARFPEVRELDARGDFPNGLRITVLERRPAALLVAGDTQLVLAGDGTVLSGVEDPIDLPKVRAEGALPAKRLGEGEQLAAVSVLGGAPAALLPELEEAGLDKRDGVVVQVIDGPELRFGNGARTEAKWAAAARVLADEDSAGAKYIDLTIPERPAAGGLAVEMVEPVAPAGEETEPPESLAPVPVEPKP